MKKPGKVLIWFLLFAGACFLLKGSMELVRLCKVKDILLVEQIEEKYRIMEAYKVLASERPRLIYQHEEDLAKLIEKEFILQALQKEGHATLDGLTEAPADRDPIARERRDKVRSAAIHAWSSYEKYAWGFDAFQPSYPRGVNEFGGLGGTIIDSLDTLYIMGMHDEFVKATEWVSTNLDFNKHSTVNVVETSVLFIGGLISAYDLSGNPLFISKAKELADRLLPAWNTANGIPLHTINLASGRASDDLWTSGSASTSDWRGKPRTLTELGGDQAEMIALSQRTGVDKYREKAEEIDLKLMKAFTPGRLTPSYMTNQINMGVLGHRFYEYLLKVWLLGNKTDHVQHYRNRWDRSMERFIRLLRGSNPTWNAYDVHLTERNRNEREMDVAVACFVPGMLVLGAEGASSSQARGYIAVADELAETCHNVHMSLTRTHLVGRNYEFNDGWFVGESKGHNLLRPETIKSLLYLWRKTGDVKYREWGWDIFEAFESRSRISTGYSTFLDVDAGEKLARITRFFLADNLKYLYLLFSPSSVIPLDEWVFNTAGHPVRIVPRPQGAEYSGSQNNSTSHWIPIAMSAAPRGRTNLQLEQEVYDILTVEGQKFLQRRASHGRAE